MESKIKTFEDACKDQGVDSNHPKFQYQEGESVDNSGPAFERLKVIRNALLGNKKLSWEYGSEHKHFPWFKMDCKLGCGFCSSDCSPWGSCSFVSERLALDTKEKAIYFGDQFEEDWYKYMVE